MADPNTEWLQYEPGQRFWATKCWLEEQNLTAQRRFEILEKDPNHEVYLVRIVLKYE